MSMNPSPPRLWISSNAQHTHHFDCTFTGKNMGSHSRVPKPDLSTCRSFSRLFHRLFTAFSRVFMVFSHVWLLRCSYIVFYNFCGNCEDINFISNKYRKGTLTAAILQTGGTPTSSRQRFSLLGPHQTWCSRGSRWESLHFILLHNHDVDGKSWRFLITPAIIWCFVFFCCLIWFGWREVSKS